MDVAEYKVSLLVFVWYGMVWLPVQGIVACIIMYMCTSITFYTHMYKYIFSPLFQRLNPLIWCVCVCVCVCVCARAFYGRSSGNAKEKDTAPQAKGKVKEEERSDSGKEKEEEVARSVVCV